MATIVRQVTELLGQIEAGEPGHVHIEDDQVESVIEQVRKGSIRIGRERGAMAGTLEDGLEHQAIRLLVLDGQDAHRRGVALVLDVEVAEGQHRVDRDWLGCGKKASDRECGLEQGGAIGVVGDDKGAAELLYQGAHGAGEGGHGPVDLGERQFDVDTQLGDTRVGDGA